MFLIRLYRWIVCKLFQVAVIDVYLKSGQVVSLPVNKHGHIDVTLGNDRASYNFTGTLVNGFVIQPTQIAAVVLR